MSNHTSRENWLKSAVGALTPRFSGFGFAIPPVKISCGFATSGNPKTTLGQTFPRESSGDGVNEIFISPKIEEPIDVLDTLVHELCHAIDDCQSGHGADFKEIATCIGLEGPARSSRAGAELLMHLSEVAESLGAYPHKSLVLQSRSKGTLRQSKAKCKSCGYEVKLVKKWASYGAPICPKDNIRMEEVLAAQPESEESNND